MKNKLLITGLMVFSISGVYLSESSAQTNDIPKSLTDIANSVLLPTPFFVYINNSTVINHPAPGFIEKSLPTINEFTGKPGCYVACYSHDAQNSIYKVSQDIYMNGQIRISGSYKDRMCVPAVNLNKLTVEGYFKQLCTHKITSCNNSSCWGGGDTGGWFGIQ